MRSAEDLSLHELAAKNDVQNLTSKLSSAGQDVDDLNDEMQTPLHEAAKHNVGKSHFEVAEILLNNGADPNALDLDDRTPLWYLIQNGGDVEILKLFFTFKADFTSFFYQKNLLLVQAINANNVDTLKFLVKDIGFDVNHLYEYDAVTSLHYAADMNMKDSHYEVMKFLLEMGADPNVQNSKGKTPLHSVIRSGNLRVFDLFLSHKVNLGVLKNVIFEDVGNNSDAKVLDKLFLLSNSGDLNIDINQRDEYGQTPLHHAVIQRSWNLELLNTEIIKCLLKHGANINALDNDGITPLISALNRINGFFFEDQKEASYFADFLFEQTDFSVAHKRMYIDKYVGKFILKHLAKLKFLSISIHPTLQKIIEDHTNIKDYFDECTKELEVMSTTRPRNSWISFFDLLVDDRRKLKNYAGNEDLIEDYKNNDLGKRFPIYETLLRRNVEKGIRKRELFDKSSVLLCDFLPIFNPNHLIVKDILDCVLSKKYLSKFLYE